MKILMGVGFAGASGKAGDTVAATWKGRQYFRRRVTPKNPKTAAQLAVRAHLARMAAWFRSLSDPFEALLDNIGTDRQLSGYNVMSSVCLKALTNGGYPPLVPDNKDLIAMASITAARTAVRDIQVTPARGASDVTNFWFLFVAPVDPTETAKVEADLWTQTNAVGHANDGVAKKVGTRPYANKDYYVAVILADTNSLATATKISGGVAAMSDSGP